jgi:hypothetical protein
MPDNKKLSDMSNQELRDLDVKLTSQKAELRRVRLAVARERNVRHDREMVKRKLDKLSLGEKEAMVQAIQAEGIGSGASVGTPGSD